MTHPFSKPQPLIVGTRVRLRGLCLDEAMTPVTGTVEDIFRRPDWSGGLAYVVMFDHDDDSLPPGGEFSARKLEAFGDNDAAKVAEGRQR